MPLDDINKLKSYDEIIAERIAEWEQESIAQIAKEIGKIGKMSKADLARYDAESEAGRMAENVASALVMAGVLNSRDIKKAYQSEMEQWQESARPMYEYRGVTPGDNGTDLNGYAAQSIREMWNYTETEALCVIDANGRAISLRDGIYRSLGEATDVATRGEADFYTAMRKTVQSLGGNGVRVDYGGGVTRRLDTVVRQNLLYGIKKANIAYSNRVASELDCDGYEIDAHNNSRPSHEFMQGKQYCIGVGRWANGRYFIGFDEVDPESPDGLSASVALNDYGCRHYRTPIICGISEPRFTKEQLQKIKDDNAKEYEIDGRKGNRYYWSQRMRALETSVRAAKGEINALKAYDNSEQRIKELRGMVRAYRAKYKQIAETTGISPDFKRMTVYK